MSQERLGYPTQKPLSLLERIIAASSQPGDVILDPFCGCGTTVHAAQKLGRHWLGIDITHLAIALIEKRLRDAFPEVQYSVEGTPKDLEGAHNLAERDKYQFQWWACSLVKAQPYQGKPKGADGGIDGLIFIKDIVNDKPVDREIIVSVKGGKKVELAMIKELIATVDHRQDTIMGFFVTFTKPTQPMLAEAAESGFYTAGNGKQYPRIQILTIEQLLAGTKQPEYMDFALGSETFKKAGRENTEGIQQSKLF